MQIEELFPKSKYPCRIRTCIELPQKQLCFSQEIYSHEPIRRPLPLSYGERTKITSTDGTLTVELIKLFFNGTPVYYESGKDEELIPVSPACAEERYARFVRAFAEQYEVILDESVAEAVEKALAEAAWEEI